VNGTAHPTAALNEVVHQRHRLGILTIAAEADRVEFGYLRDTLELTPGNLSRHVTVLENAGLVDVEKGYAGRRPRTWVHITRAGRHALAAELATLATLVTGHRAVTAEKAPTRPGRAGRDRKLAGVRPRTQPDSGN
jgi:DNA-binding MarR family transcriptional regulator